MKQAAAYFNSLDKVKGVLFEAMHLFCEKEMSLERMKREPVRSTVCMFFTSWQALHLVLLFDEKL